MGATGRGSNPGIVCWLSPPCASGAPPLGASSGCSHALISLCSARPCAPRAGQWPGSLSSSLGSYLRPPFCVVPQASVPPLAE